jgi:hypothetical protein
MNPLKSAKECLDAIVSAEGYDQLEKALSEFYETPVSYDEKITRDDVHEVIKLGEIAVEYNLVEEWAQCVMAILDDLDDEYVRRLCYEEHIIETMLPYASNDPDNMILCVFDILISGNGMFTQQLRDVPGSIGRMEQLASGCEDGTLERCILNKIKVLSSGGRLVKGIASKI